jgi:replicative DNA helicase
MMSEILQSHKFEDGILGTLIMQDETRPILMPKLSVDTFTTTYRKETFEAIQSLYDSNREIDPMTVEEWLKDQKGWDDAGCSGIIQLEGLYSGQESTVDDLNDRRARRELLSGLETITGDIRTKAEPATHFLTQIDRLVNNNVSEIQIPGLNYTQVMDAEAQKDKGAKLWIDDRFMQNTFFAETGFHRGEILVPFGDTGSGKTYFAVWLASRLLESGHKGVFVIRESRAKKLFERFERAVEDKSLLDNLIVADIEQGIQNLTNAVSAIKYHNAVIDIDFFVIDHLKILPVEGLKAWQDQERISTIINRCIYLSQEINALGIPISQVNRSTLYNASGWNKDPDLSNLYGSSAIEQAAHMAVSIFRPANYDDLCIYDHNGELTDVEGSNHKNDLMDRHEPNSVFIRQKKVREGSLYRRYVKFLHTDKGLVRANNLKKEYSTEEQEAPF